MDIEILIVDDDQVDRAIVRRVLRAAGLQLAFQEAADCAAAIAALQQQSFDCVFVDYQLPDGDGLALVQTVRRAGITVPLVVLTGQGDEQIAVEVMKAGASDYLAKAKVSSDTLPKILQQALRIHKAERQAVLANQRLSESEARFRSLVQNSLDIITLLTAEGTIRYTSPSVARILGYQPEDLVGQNAFEGVHPEDALAVQAVVAHIQQNPSVAVPVELRFRHANGSWIYLEAVANNLLLDPSVKSVVVNSRDITERKRAEQSQRFLAEASTLLSATLEYQATLTNLACLVVPDLADWCFVDLIEADGRCQRVAVSTVNPQVASAALQHCYAPSDLPSGVSQVIRTGQPEVVSEVADHRQAARAVGIAALDQDRHDFPPAKRSGWDIEHQAWEIHSYLCVPLLANGRVLGAITFVAVSDRHYSAADLPLAEDLAHRAALAVDNARLYQEAREVGENLRRAILILGEQQQQLRSLQQLTNLLNQRLADLPGLLQVMVNAVREAIPKAQFCLIMLYNPQSNLLELTAEAGSGAIPGNQAMQELLDQVCRTGQSRLIQADSPDCNSQLPASVFAVTIESAQAGRLGVLAIGNWQDGQAFDAENRFLLVAFEEQAAIALNNAFLINTLEEREERLAAQNDILARQNQELESQRQQIQLQNLKLLEAAQLKSQFLATMTHELRTPMNAITGFSQLLLRQRHNKLTPQQVNMVERILSNGKNLLALINNILDLSIIEAGRLALNLEEFNLVEQVISTTEELRSLADQKDLVLQVHTDLQNCWVINDRQSLRQVLVNLISNAIKFTNTGSVQIEVGESCDRLVIVVRDTGIGIAPADLQHIFEEFWQVDQTTTRKFPGTGLGLAITKQLVHSMHGTITVKSSLGQGSTFQVELPRQVLPAASLTVGLS